MAFDFGFYNSVSQDRLYDALQMSKIFDGLINDGVYATIGDAFVVKAAGDMDVTVGTGQAWFNHTWNRVDAILRLTVPASEVILNRIDAVVIEVDSRTANRTNSVKIIKGTPATNPVKPVLANADGLYQHPLAYITVEADVSAITQANIEYAVGTTACPFVTGIIDTIDATNMLLQWTAQYAEWKQNNTEDFDQWAADSREDYEQWETSSRGMFYEWFNNLVYVLDGDVAGHLQNQIDGIMNGFYVGGTTLFVPSTEQIRVEGSTIYFHSTA